MVDIPGLGLMFLSDEGVYVLTNDGAYPGTCRDLTAAERAAREAAGRPAALRLRAGPMMPPWRSAA
jgi:hypothetical protein